VRAVSSDHGAAGDTRSGLPLPGAAIYVVATTIAATSEAIAAASALARAKDSHVHIIAARPMPSDWSRQQQTTPVQAFARRIKQAIPGAATRIDVLPCVCRRLIDVTQLLPNGGLVIVAGPSHRWWPTPEQRLAHDLKGLGHRVMFVHTTGNATVDWAG
jgi:hypothetical protein